MRDILAILKKMRTGSTLYDYYNQAIERVKRHIAQPTLFEPSIPEQTQPELF